MSCSHENSSNGISYQSYVFDAYGTLFDFHSAVEEHKIIIGDKSEELSKLWREKQIQYTWLHSMMGSYSDFWTITKEALNYAMESVNINNSILHSQLMNLYLKLKTFNEVNKTLNSLKNKDCKIAILSNGTHQMLNEVIKNSSLGDLIDLSMSIDDIEIYKPNPLVYQMATDKLKINKSNICFVSANNWDVAGAKSFGFHSVWVNRNSLISEKLPYQPDSIINSLDDLT
jgi:2-haloacid dehalogenase